MSCGLWVHATLQRHVTASHERPYRILAVSLYTTEADAADRLTDMLRRGGWPKANRSLVIREALLRLDEELASKPADEIVRNFTDRHARRAASADTVQEARPTCRPDTPRESQTAHAPRAFNKGHRDDP